jgi:predicted nuclease with TOPRIM domain
MTITAEESIPTPLETLHSLARLKHCAGELETLNIEITALRAKEQADQILSKDIQEELCLLCKEEAGLIEKLKNVRSDKVSLKRLSEEIEENEELTRKEDVLKSMKVEVDSLRVFHGLVEPSNTGSRKIRLTIAKPSCQRQGNLKVSS